mmetsp:Transcript_21103/g.20272  ORF Transcript_21103/g.20272 Transcript_21103/m.20272 type:complete len:199 (-) Transcript_21103:1575-2171(-)
MHLLEVRVLQEAQLLHQLGLQLGVLLQIDLLVHAPLPLLPVQILLLFVQQLLFIVHQLELLIVLQVRNEIFIPRPIPTVVFVVSTLVIVVVLVVVGEALPLGFAPGVLLPSGVRRAVCPLTPSVPSQLGLPPLDVTALPRLQVAQPAEALVDVFQGRDHLLRGEELLDHDGSHPRVLLQDLVLHQLHLLLPFELPPVH